MFSISHSDRLNNTLPCTQIDSNEQEEEEEEEEWRDKGRVYPGTRATMKKKNKQRGEHYLISANRGEASRAKE